MSSEIATKEPEVLPATTAPAMSPLAPANSETAALIGMIERVARDPSIDLDRLDRLIDLKLRLTAIDAKKAYDAAFAQMQPQLPVVERKGRISGESKRTGDKLNQSFGRWEDISPAIAPILAKHGFGISFRQSPAPAPNEGKLRITSILSHEQGHREETHFDLPHDATGSKNSVQAIGSSVSYGKRYGATLLLNIVTKGEDDDAGSSGPRETISDTQCAGLRDLASEVGADLPRFLTYMSKVAGREIANLADVPAKHYQAAVTALNMKRTAR